MDARLENCPALGQDKVLLHGTSSEVWERFCGFLGLQIPQFQDIQRQLLEEQLSLVAASPLASVLLGGPPPRTAEDLRERVPLTTYQEYAPLLEGRKERLLPVRPALWAYTSSQGDTGKWVPFTQRAYERLLDTAIASVILACARERGEVSVGRGERMLYSMAPRPYLSGFVAYGLPQRAGWRAIPPPELPEQRGFRASLEDGFQIALRTGVDVISSMGSILLRVGELFTERASRSRPSPELLHPAILYRLGRGYLSSRLGRRDMLPKDLWPAKAIVAWGGDTDAYREAIAYYWGQEPYEFFGMTEGGILAMQGWNRKGLYFSPFVAFLEFVPEEEWLRSKLDQGYRPRTVLMHEVQAGQTYELVVTSFYGMPFLRYRSGYLVQVLANGDTTAGIALPQFKIAGRADNVIDLAGFTRLSQETLERAIQEARLECSGWMARKVNRPRGHALRMYLALRQRQEVAQVERALHEALKAVDAPYRALEELLGVQPLEVVLVAPEHFQQSADILGLGARDRWQALQVNPPESLVQELLARAR